MAPDSRRDRATTVEFDLAPVEFVAADPALGVARKAGAVMLLDWLNDRHLASN